MTPNKQQLYYWRIDYFLGILRLNGKHTDSDFVLRIVSRQIWADPIHHAKYGMFTFRYISLRIPETQTKYFNRSKYKQAAFKWDERIKHYTTRQNIRLEDYWLYMRSYLTTFTLPTSYFGNCMHEMSQTCKLSNAMLLRSLKNNISIFKNNIIFLLITPKWPNDVMRLYLHSVYDTYI